MSRLSSFVAAGLLATVAACHPQVQPAQPTQAACDPSLPAQARADRRDPQELIAYPAPARTQPVRCTVASAPQNPAQQSPDDPMRLLDIP